jgi:hypothetical protein
MVKLLHRLGFVYKKTRAVPCKADPEKQAEFVEEPEKLFTELSDNEVVYFNAAVHPQHNTRPDYGWILQGEDFEMPTNPGRKRVNINGALNLIERLWKFFRKKVSNYYFYEYYAEFREEVLGFFKNIGQYKSELESLLTLKFCIVSTA